MIQKYKKIQFRISNKIYNILNDISKKNSNSYCKKIIFKHCMEINYPPMAKITNDEMIWFYQILDEKKIKECIKIIQTNITHFLDTFVISDKDYSVHGKFFYLIDYLEYISHSTIVLGSIVNETKTFRWSHDKGVNYSIVWGIAIKKLFQSDNRINLKIKIDVNSIIITADFAEQI